VFLGAETRQEPRCYLQIAAAAVAVAVAGPGGAGAVY
jgi:hypothetical protein